jgi:phenylacetate-coenzyme A ligase PaaK-like adenylate-forming protein
LLFRAEVRAVPPGTLPRFEMKARRLVRKRKNE